MILPNNRRHIYIGVIYAILGSIAFSGKTIIIKLAYQHGVEAMTLLALRMIFALPFFLLMAYFSGFPRLSRRDWLIITGLGFLGYCLGSYLDFIGLQYISAGLGRLILYLHPSLVLLMSAVFLKQPIRAQHWLSLGLSYCGIALVFHDSIALGGAWDKILLGSGLVFTSAVIYAIYLLTGSRYVQKMGSMSFTAYASIFASFFVICNFLGFHGTTALIVPGEVYRLALIMAIFSTVLPLWLLAEGLKRIGANQVSLLGCIGPLSTMVLGQIFLLEPISLTQIFGAVLVLAGMIVISIKPHAAVNSSLITK